MMSTRRQPIPVTHPRYQPTQMTDLKDHRVPKTDTDINLTRSLTRDVNPSQKPTRRKGLFGSLIRTFNPSQRPIRGTDRPLRLSHLDERHQRPVCSDGQFETLTYLGDGSVRSICFSHCPYTTVVVQRT